MREATIRSAVLDDAPQIARIYNHYVTNTYVTFEEEPVSSKEMSERIARVLSNHCWLVYERDQAIEGYAYASAWHTRASYRRSVETTVYLDCEKVGGGRGSQLYAKLLEELRARGFHTAIGGISLPNPASIALHEKFGFKKVAHYKEVGWKFDQWIDVGYWQLML